MKILIIITRFAKGAYTYDKNSTEKNYTYMVPLGLPYISAFLKKNGYDVTILNLNHLEGKVQDLIRDELSKNQYNIIFTGGVSIYFPDSTGLCPVYPRGFPGLKDCDWWRHNIRAARDHVFSPETRFYCYW